MTGLRKWATLKGNWGEGLGKAICGGEGRAEGTVQRGEGEWGQTGWVETGKLRGR